MCFKELWRSAVVSRRTDASALWLGHIKSLSRPESDVIFRPWQDNAGRGFLDTVPWCCSSVLIATVVSYVHNAPLMWNAESLRPSVGMSRGLSHSSTGNSSCCATRTLLSCTKHITVKLSLSAPRTDQHGECSRAGSVHDSKTTLRRAQSTEVLATQLGLEALTVPSIHSHRHVHRLQVMV